MGIILRKLKKPKPLQYTSPIFICEVKSVLNFSSPFSASPFFIGSPVASILIGGGALVSFWLVLCEYLEERRPAVRYVPGAVFALASAAVLRLRMRRHRALYGALWALVTSVLLENVVFLLIIDPHVAGGQALPFFPERNFAENALVLCCAFAACTGAWRNLSLRRTEPPTQGGASLETFIDQNLVAYAAARQLSKREAEVLRLVLLGKDNQNIATSMHLAPSTVKVHMHHILQKAERSNRKELIQDFWEFS